MLAALGIPLAFFGLVAWVVWIDARRRTLRLDRQTELHQKVLERFQSGPELAEFLQTEGGKRFLEAGTSPHTIPQLRILTSTQWGLILFLLGLVLVVAGAWLKPADRGAWLIGSAVGAIGLGFLLSAAVAYRLLRKWGMLESKDTGAG